METMPTATAIGIPAAFAAASVSTPNTDVPIRQLPPCHGRRERWAGLSGNAMKYGTPDSPR